jgi:hypothetical protein
MIYAKIENPEQEKRLMDELKTSKNKNWYRRLEVIANSAKGVTVDNSAKHLTSLRQPFADTSMPLIKVDWTLSNQ